MPRKPITKKAFVAGLPETLSNAETVAKAKAIGIIITPKQVSKIRSNIRIALKANGTYFTPTPGPKLRSRRNGHSHSTVISPNGEQELVTNTDTLTQEFEDAMQLPRQIAAENTDVQRFKRMVAEMGLVRARKALAEVEAAILRST